MSEKVKKAKQDESIAAVANKIWMAGLGALRTAENEGSNIFKSLVKKGTDFQNERKEISQQQIEKINKIVKGGVGSVKGKIEDITSQKERIWEKIRLEEVFSAVIKTFGVATKKDIDILVKKIESLSNSVKESQAAAKKAPKPKIAAPKVVTPKVTAPKKAVATKKAAAAEKSVPVKATTAAEATAPVTAVASS